MTVDREQIEQIAHLARLKLDPNAVNQYSQEMTTILDWMKQLEQVDVSGITPMAHPLPVNASFRTDVVTELNHRETIQAKVNQAHDGLYWVPQVLEDDK